MYFQWYFREIVNNRPVSRKSIKLKLRKKSFSNLQISLNVKESLVSLHFLYSAGYQKWWGFQKKGLCYSWHLHQVYFEKILLSKVFLWGNIRAQSSTCRLYGLPMSNCWKQNLTMKMKNNSWISRLGTVRCGTTESIKVLWLIVRQRAKALTDNSTFSPDVHR